MIVIEDEDAIRIDDSDGDTSSDGDICERCECTREEHTGDRGECSCGRCRKFQDLA